MTCQLHIGQVSTRGLAYTASQSQAISAVESPDPAITMLEVDDAKLRADHHCLCLHQGVIEDAVMAEPVVSPGHQSLFQLCVIPISEPTAVKHTGRVPTRLELDDACACSDRNINAHLPSDLGRVSGHTVVRKFITETKDAPFF